MKPNIVRMAAAGRRLQSIPAFTAPPAFGMHRHVSAPRHKPTTRNGQSGQSALYAIISKTRQGSSR